MPKYTIRPFLPGDLVPVVSLWNRCLSKDPISEERFWRLFLLDENFDPDGALVAQSNDGKVVGFLQAMVRRIPYGSLGLQSDQGWITVFFVDPGYRRRGIGTALLQRGVEFLRNKGVLKIASNGYAPYYVFPGVDADYREAHEFLPVRGFTRSVDAVAMGMPLEGVRMPEAVRIKKDSFGGEGVTVRPFERTDTLPLLAFTEAHYPHWTPSLRDSLQHGSTEVLVAVLGPTAEVLAYAQWQNPHNDPPHGAPGRFGPFGVRPDLHSQGIGAVVFYEMIAHAAGSGSRYLWFGWAGGRNLSFYERAGCKVTRRFQLYKATT